LPHCADWRATPSVAIIDSVGFSADERALLLAVKGVGPTVIDRLEQLGFDSLETLAKNTVDGIVKNSPQARAAIAGAIAAAETATQPPKRP
jgi:hypothetical protein